MEKFATSAATVPEPCSVLGTSLRPFCLGHHLLFKRLQLPFCGKPLADAPWEEIQIGLAICGQEWNETQEQFLRGSWQRVFDQWQRQLDGRHWRRLWCPRKPSKGVLLDAEVLFRAYLQDGYKKAPIWEDMPSVNTISLSAPWELVLKNKLIQNGHSEADVMRQYLPAAWYDYYTACELSAAKSCNDTGKWRKVFYTEFDWELEQRMKGAAL